MLAAFVPIVLILVLGVALGRAQVLPERAPDVLNQLVLWALLPAAILLHVPRIDFSVDLLWLGLVPWALLLVAVVLVRLTVRALGLSRGEEGALLMTVALGNTSFLGYPVIRALLGEDALPAAVVYDQLGSFLALATFGTVVLARYGGGETPSAGALAQKVVRFPPFVALVVALGLGALHVEVPTPIASVIELLGGALLPVVLLALGLGLKLEVPARDRAPLAVGLTLKLVVLPGLLLGGLILWGRDGEHAQVALLESAMPPMVTAGALAAGAKLAPELSLAMTGLGLVLAMLTLPLWMMVAQALL